MAAARRKNMNPRVERMILITLSYWHAKMVLRQLTAISLLSFGSCCILNEFNGVNFTLSRDASKNTKTMIKVQ